MYFTEANKCEQENAKNRKIDKFASMASYEKRSVNASRYVI